MRELQKLVVECENLEDADELCRYVRLEQKSAEIHCEVIRKWGRFPHRNGILQRPNTREEEEALKAGTIPSF